MAVDIRIPNITAADDAGKIVQIQRYIYQLAEQLNWAFSATETQQKQLISTMDSFNKSPAESEKEYQNIFSHIKALIIKSADIVNAYSEQIELDLAGEYVAISDFGEFRQETLAALEATSEALNLIYSRVEEIETDVEKVGTDFNNYRLEQQSYIKFGYIYDEEVSPGVTVPVTGIAVGENLTTITVDGEEIYNVENRLATFASNKLAFWQNGAIIAYFSGQRLVVDSIQLGDWLLSGTNGLAVKYLGGDMA